MPTTVRILNFSSFHFLIWCDTEEEEALLWAGEVWNFPRVEEQDFSVSYSTTRFFSQLFLCRTELLFLYELIQFTLNCYETQWGRMKTFQLKITNVTRNMRADFIVIVLWHLSSYEILYLLSFHSSLPFLLFFLTFPTSNLDRIKFQRGRITAITLLTQKAILCQSYSHGVMKAKSFS